MLKLVHINKDYPLKDQPTVHALKDVNINFRRNEFVAILGPSGCGKTTLLNITGGLDRYTNGDLIIEGRSTKKYSDHDWDTYRNHSIGFVFQTYNLVSHLTVLGNVELALTIGGIKRNERKQRAMKVIDQVGLQGLYKKMPNQLSGGQMQRVAIARALVNNPEIVLADEPTGALDSETSLQIMDLLKEVAKDRLVIMVTHNPDLANRYANRIINLKDGEVIQDSKPYSDVEEELSVRSIREKNTNRKHVAQSKMSIPTSFGLSARNLLAKFKRTALVCIAGSIGIIGVSAVLAVSTGVKSYIKDMQDDMLSGNPIAVEKSSLDLTSLMASFSKTAQQNAVTKSYEDGYIDVDSMIAYLTAQKDNLESYMVNNDINQDYIDFVDEMPKEYYAAMEKEYGINFKLNMYTDVNLTDATGSSVGEDKTLSLAELESMYIKIVKSTSYGEYASVFSLLTDVFFSCPDSEDYILSQYDLLAGNVATADDEMMLVVSSDREVTDVFLGQLGYYTQDEFVALVNKYAYGEDNPFDDGTIVRDRFTEEEMMNKEFVYVPYTSGYSFMPNPMNTETNIQNNFVNSGSVMDVPYIYNGEATSLDDLTNNAALGAKKIKISGILCAKDNVNYGCLDTGFVVSPALEQMILTDAANAGINTTLQNSYDNIYSNVPDSIGGTALTDTQKAAWKSTYTMAAPYSYSYNYKHYNEDTNQVEVINSGMGENYTSALSIINMEGMSSSSSGAMSDVFTKLFSGSYS
ncbi:MAG: ABC transporter ATP-binding protein, partial [Bacilli bacterium]